MAREKVLFVGSEIASFSLLAATLASGACAVNAAASGEAVTLWAMVSALFGGATAIAVASTLKLGARYFNQRRQEIYELIEPKRPATAGA